MTWYNNPALRFEVLLIRLPSVCRENENGSQKETKIEFENDGAAEEYEDRLLAVCLASQRLSGIADLDEFCCSRSDGHTAPA